jgi:hypothetical protein
LRLRQNRLRFRRQYLTEQVDKREVEVPEVGVETSNRLKTRIRRSRLRKKWFTKSNLRRRPREESGTHLPVTDMTKAETTSSSISGETCRLEVTFQSKNSCKWTKLMGTPKQDITLTLRGLLLSQHLVCLLIQNFNHQSRESPLRTQRDD